MIETAFGIVFLIVGFTILYRIWAQNRGLQERAPSAMDRSLFSTMDLEPAAPHFVHARSSKPAESFRFIDGDHERDERSAVLTPTGIRMENEFDQEFSGLIEDLDRPETLSRLPLDEEEPKGPKQENLGF